MRLQLGKALNQLDRQHQVYKRAKTRRLAPRTAHIEYRATLHVGSRPNNPLVFRRRHYRHAGKAVRAARSHWRNGPKNAREHLSLSIHLNSRLRCVPYSCNSHLFPGNNHVKPRFSYALVLKDELLEFFRIHFQIPRVVTEPGSKTYFSYRKLSHLKVHVISSSQALTTKTDALGEWQLT